eukprot:1093905-Prymnesium_polylepis.1
MVWGVALIRCNGAMAQPVTVRDGFTAHRYLVLDRTTRRAAEKVLPAVTCVSAAHTLPLAVRICRCARCANR